MAFVAFGKLTVFTFWAFACNYSSSLSSIIVNIGLGSLQCGHLCDSFVIWSLPRNINVSLGVLLIRASIAFE